MTGRFYVDKVSPSDTYWYVFDRNTGQPHVWVTYRVKRTAQAIADGRNA